MIPSLEIISQTIANYMYGLSQPKTAVIHVLFPICTSNYCYFKISAMSRSLTLVASNRRYIAIHEQFKPPLDYCVLLSQIIISNRSHITAV